jgi:hypothetical protein
MGHSLTVERLILDQVVGVRVPVPQPNQNRRIHLLGATVLLHRFGGARHYNQENETHTRQG